jgi:phospholipid/cholesterol/gamma-HCH transport system permease protein
MDAAQQIVRQQDCLELTGELRMADATDVWRKLSALSATSPESRRLDIDLTGASVVDGAVMSLLVELRRELAERGIASEIRGVSEHLRPILHLYHGDEPPRATVVRVPVDVISRVGQATVLVARAFERLSIFLGDLVADAARSLRKPATVDWRSIPSLAERAGIDGVAIVMLLNFLVGFVMAFQSARQLKMYGANIYVADVVGISVTRELAPLMTAIIMSGRSGAAFAAELGTMRVSEEIDALRTMGFAPAPFLIFPRVLALALVAPVLTLIGDIVGVLGGMAVAVSSLDVSARGYLAELQTAVLPSDVWTGLVKSVAFGIAIAFIGCQQGFGARGAAAGVGRGTTATVVFCLFTVVIVDTVFTILFRTFGE